jgi:hypothetical protein
MRGLYQETITALEQSLQCHLIASELDFEHGVKHVDAEDFEILDYALPNQFSRIPLFSAGEGPNKRITHVAIVHLHNNKVTDRRAIMVDDLIAGSTPISEVIGLLSNRPFYFVLHTCLITKIVTTADLNRLPVRTYLHTVLDHVEWLLAEWIQSTFPNSEWMTLLSESAQLKIRQLHETKRSEDFDTRLIDCTTLTQKAVVVEKSDELVRRLSRGGEPSFRKAFQRVKRLRNRLGHGLPPLDKEADALRDHLRHAGQLTKRADLEWLNGVLRTLHAWIDALSDVEPSRRDTELGD